MEYRQIPRKLEWYVGPTLFLGHQHTDVVPHRDYVPLFLLFTAKAGGVIRRAHWPSRPKSADGHPPTCWA
jgi:hypothetical protein